MALESTASLSVITASCCKLNHSQWLIVCLACFGALHGFSISLMRSRMFRSGPACHRTETTRFGYLTVAGRAVDRLCRVTPDTIDPKDPLASFEGRAGALLWSVSTADGARKAQYRLDAPPAFDGLIAAGGKLYMTTIDGAVSCWAD